MKISILHLYDDLLNLYGEIGNIKILSKHLTDQGAEVFIDKKTVDDEIDFNIYDFIYMGSGTEKNQIVALKDLMRYKNELKNAIDNNIIILSTGNSYEIFGQYIQETSQSKIEALALFDYFAVRETERKTSDVIYQADFTEKKFIGYINKMSSVYHKNNHLFSVEFGLGDNEKTDFEGFRTKNFFGTGIIGPILVRNPQFLAYLISIICKKIDSEFIYNDIQYENENKAYENTLHELMLRKKG